MKIGICEHCGNNGNLIKAHIIPECFWNAENNSVGPLAIFSDNQKSRPLRSNIGVYDENILCNECEDKFREFDEHGCKTLLQEKGILTLGEGGAKGISYDKADGSKLHKFITFVAWRASRSQHSYFSRVSIGKYEDLLKRSFNGDNIAQTQIDCFISEYDNGKIPQFSPFYELSDGVGTIVISAARFVFVAKIYDQIAPVVLESLAIKTGNTVLSLVIPWQESSHMKIAEAVVKANPWPRFWKKNL